MKIYSFAKANIDWTFTASFKIGLLIRLLCLLFFIPVIQERWFTDFVISWLRDPSLDPWLNYLNFKGSEKAFPYGYIMLFSHAPTVAAGMAFDYLLDLPGRAATIGFAVSILLADIFFYFTLLKWVGAASQKNVDHFYWLSPLVLFICYIHGQTDIIPVLLLFMAIFFLEKNEFSKAGLMLGLSVSAKLSMLLIAPFLFMHVFLKNKRLCIGRKAFLLSFLIGSSLAFFAILTTGGQIMILGNAELIKALQFGIVFSEFKAIQIFPFSYFILLFSAWLLAPLNRNSLEGFIAITLCMILLTTAAPIGWYFWLVPAFTLYSTHASRFGKILIFVFYFVIVAQASLHNETFFLSTFEIDFGKYIVSLYLKILTPLSLDIFSTLLTTFASAVMVVLASRIYARMIADNWLFKLTRKPVLIGLAGDSGAGKDTLANALSDAIGSQRVTQVLGDDYHMYPRRGPIWKALTHLDPRANEIAAMTNDVLNLARGKNLFVAHYDHDTGLFTNRREITANEFIIVNGLHSLYPRALSERYAVSVYLDMDKELRAIFKTVRDSTKRGATLEQVRENIIKRLPDGERFIQPQQNRADIVFTVKPIRQFNESCLNIPLQLSIKTRLDIDLDYFCRELLAINHIAATVEEDFGQREVVIYDGFVDSLDARAFATRVLSNCADLTSLSPDWKDGILGIMQIFVIYVLSSKAAKLVNGEGAQ